MQVTLPLWGFIFCILISVGVGTIVTNAILSVFNKEDKENEK